ncbi:MAG: hypothetical protein JXR69_00315 [Candidatus Delongbacteria bacterium]|nr:hypothetical protein [Candidatus Delongbacteria bacterium]
MFSNEIKNIHKKFKEGKITKEEEKKAIGILMRYEMQAMRSKERSHSLHFMYLS